MPTYDYLCETNGRKIEVSHKMSESLNNWGELCERAGIDPGDTPADTPVRRLIGGAAVLSGGMRSEPEPACATGGCCAGGMCGLE